jgi:UrcA family protein
MNTSTQIKTTVALLSMCGLMALSTFHSANAANEVLPSKRVNFADLDISKPAGAHVLYGRIVAAARQVCELNQFQTLAAKRLMNNCIDHAIDKAVRDVDSPAVTALRPSTWLKVASN